MKNIEIRNDDFSQTHGSNIFADGKPIRNCRNSILVREFSEDEILYIIGDENFKKYEDGKYKFKIEDWKIMAIQGIADPAVFNNNVRIDWAMNYKDNI